jgi:hypothetical protein
MSELAPSSKIAAALGALALAWLAPSVAHAAEFQMRGTLGGEASTWRGDGAIDGGLALGLRFADLASFYLMTRVGYAAVDERMLTMVQVGGQIWGRVGVTRPYFRFGLVHQHEESAAAVGSDVAGALFGVGDGIRHRAGMEWAVGVDYPFAKRRSWQFFGSAEALLSLFPDSKGPEVYGGGSLGLGFNYSL